QSVFEGNVDFVMHEAWTGLESVPSWDPHVKFAWVFTSLTNYSDIITYGSNPVFILSGRDMVAARIYRP
ncbi:hypothetical protein PMAYCL1PPCAC_08581, partial [Pristionchus mayeri]